MRLRPAALAVLLTAAVTVPAAATMTAAAAAKPAAKPSPSSSAKPAPKPTAKPTKPAAKPKPVAKPAKPVRVSFTANGIVAAVDVTAGRVSVTAKAGTKDAKGTTVTVSVPAGTRILLNGSRKTLGDLAAGYRITVTGTRTGSVYTASHIEATRAKTTPAPVPSPTAAPSPSPTDSPAPDPVDSPTPDRTDAPTPGHTDAPAPEPVVTNTPAPEATA
jgi:glucose/arabinose dehydrogenase